MKPPVVLLLVLAAAAGGYFAGSKTTDDRGGRAESRPTDNPEYRRSVIASLSDEEADAVARRRYTDLERWRAAWKAVKKQAEIEKLPEEQVPDEELLRGFKEAMHGMLPQWKSIMSVTAAGVGRKIAENLNLDEVTAKKVSDAFDKEGGRTAEIAVSVVAGEFKGTEDAATDAFAWMLGTAGTMSDELALELSGTLSDEQIGAVREEMRIRNKSEMKAQAEMQIRRMSLPDLNETQRTELKEMFSDGGMMKEQSRVWSELMKNPRALVNAKTDEDWQRMVSPAMEGNRRRMRAILDDKQYKAYEAYEKRAIKEKRVWVEPYLSKAPSAAKAK